MYRASRDYSVPESTLRDRTRGMVDLDVMKGFSAEEEEKICWSRQLHGLDWLWVWCIRNKIYGKELC